MGKEAIQQFIDTGIKLKEEQQKHSRDLSMGGVLDLSGDMPASMHEWMNNIKIYVKRNLTNHPLYEDFNLTLFHNKNNIQDYEKMMGLLKALSQDLASSENVNINEEPKSVLETYHNNSRKKDYDVFISHASADKSDYVNELYLAIKELGINIFYDSTVLSWGDNWKDSILKGTEQSEFAIIVISENFFGREWTERELSEFLQRQNKMKQKIVLPLLHNVTFEQLKDKYPLLQYIQSIQSDKYSFEQITILLAKELIKRYKD